jgi:CBS domain-containing protein
MTLEDILGVKGTDVFVTQPGATLQEVVDRLVRCNCGSLVVCQTEDPGADMIGIITERDILRACAARRASLDQLHVRDVMSTDLATASPKDKVENVMGLMTERRIRHLPVVRDGKLAGLVSIGDVVKAQHDLMAMENHYLKTYIQG